MIRILICLRANSLTIRCSKKRFCLLRALTHPKQPWRWTPAKREHYTHTLNAAQPQGLGFIAAGALWRGRWLAFLAADSRLESVDKIAI